VHPQSLGLSDDLPVPFHAEPILPLYSLHGKQEWRFQTATVLSEISESRNHMSLANDPKLPFV